MDATTPEIMTDKGSWTFSDGQIQRIKQSDPDAMATFYFDNYKIFLGMARKYVWNKRYICNDYGFDVDDLMQQVYVDLPYYNYSSRTHLYHCIVHGSFWRCMDGGITTTQSKVIKRLLMVSYDAPVKGSDNEDPGSYLLDKFASAPSPDEVINSLEELETREERDKKICEFLERTVKNKKHLNAIFCQLFMDIPQNQVRGNEYEQYKLRENKSSRVRA